MRRTSIAVLVLAIAMASCMDTGRTSFPPPYHPPGPPVVPAYPRLGLYAGVGSVGFPFVLPDSSLDPATLDAWARYDQVVAHATPLCDMRTDIVHELRARNPKISIIAYVMGCNMWPGGGYHPSSYYYHHWCLLNDGPGPGAGPNNHYLYWQDGRTCEDAWMNFNLAEVKNGRYVASEAIAEEWTRDIASTGLFNGIFLDCFAAGGCEWIETPANQFDYVRAGYATKAEFFEGWKKGAARLGDRLRELVGPDFVIIGNAGQPPPSLYASFNGWMRENYPWQNGGTWYSNMYRNPGGVFNDDRNLRQRPHNYIFTAADPPSQPTSSYNRQKMRWGLGSACLTEAFGVFGDSSCNLNPANGGTRFDLWWYDEYGVDRASGAASNLPEDHGWLGMPTGAPYQQVWSNPAPDQVTNGGFETDTTGWQFIPLSPGAGTMSRDTASPGEGTASARLTVTNPGPYDWSVYFHWTTDFTFAAGKWYSLTFRARASTERDIHVGINPPAGQPWDYRTQRITTGWADYQLAFYSGAGGTGHLRFDVGGVTTGDVWLDGVRVQEGTTHVYRRDFDHGIVLVNPDNTPKTVPLGGSFRRILGTVSPDVNDGATVTSQALSGQDAIFLLKP